MDEADFKEIISCYDLSILNVLDICKKYAIREHKGFINFTLINNLLIYIYIVFDRLITSNQCTNIELIM